MRAGSLTSKRMHGIRPLVLVAAACTAATPTLVAAGVKARQIGATVYALLAIAIAEIEKAIGGEL